MFHYCICLNVDNLVNCYINGYIIVMLIALFAILIVNVL
jgi:hypothetical protein